MRERHKTELERHIERQNAEHAKRLQREREQAKAAQEEERIKRQFRHDWAVAIVSAAIGALISRPVWAGIDAAIALIAQ